MAWVHWRFAARPRRGGARRDSPLLFVVLGGFNVSVPTSPWVIGCFTRGWDFSHHFPLVGGRLLGQRILYLIFGFFFVMLVFSNLIIGYSTLFKNQ